MAILEDASTPATVTANTTVAAVTTASFSPPANALLIAICSATYSVATHTGAISWTGSGSFTVAKRENTAGNFKDEVVYYLQVGAAPGAVTVTYDANSTTEASVVILSVRVLTGAQSGAAALGASVASTTALQAALSPNVAGGSYIACAGGGFNASDNTAAAANTTTLSHVFKSGAGIAATGKLTNLTSASPGSVTLGWTNVPSGNIGFAAQEILPALTAASDFNFVKPPTVMVTR